MSTTIERWSAACGVTFTADAGMPCACPTDADQARAVLAFAAAENIPVLPLGSGSKLARCRPEWVESQPGIALSTRAMDQVVEYVAGDGTITAQAGATVDRLRATVSAGGHRLSPDVAAGERCTLGGLLGAGLSGIDRLQHGPLRHHVLGVTALLADGTQARSGGRLVKNVTGFDLHRLYTGARGTLCVILEASLRLFPEPEQELAFSLACADWDVALERAGQLRAANLPALALVLESRTEDVLLHLILAGRSQHLQEAERSVAALLPRAQRLEGSAAAERRSRLREAAAPGGAWPQLTLQAPVHRFQAALAAAHSGLREQELVTRSVAQPALGTCDLFVPALEAADSSGPLLAVRAATRQAGGHLQAAQLPTALHAALAPAADSPTGRWQAALAGRFDPQGRFASPSFPTLRP